MKIPFPLMTLLLAFASIAAGGELQHSKDIARKLVEPVRSHAKVTQIFSREAYRQLNPGLDPGTRGIVVVAASGGQQEQATVSVSPVAVSFDNIRFKIDSVELADEESARQLMELVAALKELGKGHSFIIEGHTCDLGEAAYNQKLSERRALAVGLFLRSKGVNCELVPLGFGEGKPATSNANERERAANRRVMVRRKA